MPDSWDPKQYKERAKKWRDKAASLPEGRERDTCVTLAEAYEELAEIIEAQRPASREAHRHLDLPLQAPVAEEEAADRGSGNRAEGRVEAKNHTGASQR
jgi:hypothetical protein